MSNVQRTRPQKQQPKAATKKHRKLGHPLWVPTLSAADWCLIWGLVLGSHNSCQTQTMFHAVIPFMLCMSKQNSRRLHVETKRRMLKFHANKTESNVMIRIMAGAWSHDVGSSTRVLLAHAADNHVDTCLNKSDGFQASRWIQRYGCLHHGNRCRHLASL